MKLGAACCGVVMVIVACSAGNDRLSASAYARHASALCRRGNQAVVLVELPPLTSGRGAAGAVGRVVELQRRTIDRLRDLRPPERLTVTLQKWIALLDQGTDELELMARRLRAGARDEALGYGAKATRLLDRAAELVAPLRVTSCRGPLLPGV